MKTMADLWNLWVTPAEFFINLHTLYGLFYNNFVYWLDTNAILESLTFSSIMFIRSYYLSVFKGLGSGRPFLMSAFLFAYFKGSQLKWTVDKTLGSWLSSLTDKRIPCWFVNYHHCNIKFINAKVSNISGIHLKWPQLASPYYVS